MLGRLLVLALSLPIVAAGCSSTPEGSASERTLAYMKILSETEAGTTQVGWLEKRERTDADGIVTVVDFVKTLSFEVRGYVRSEGSAVKYVDRAPAMEEAVGVAREYHELPRATRDQLVRMILDLPVAAKVTFVKASVADIRR